MQNNKPDQMKDLLESLSIQAVTEVVSQTANFYGETLWKCRVNSCVIGRNVLGQKSRMFKSLKESLLGLLVEHHEAIGGVVGNGGGGSKEDLTHTKRNHSPTLPLISQFYFHLDFRTTHLTFSVAQCVALCYNSPEQLNSSGLCSVLARVEKVNRIISNTEGKLFLITAYRFLQQKCR